MSGEADIGEVLLGPELFAVGAVGDQRDMAVKRIHFLDEVDHAGHRRG